MFIKPSTMMEGLVNRQKKDEQLELEVEVEVEVVTVVILFLKLVN